MTFSWKCYSIYQTCPKSKEVLVVSRASCTFSFSSPPLSLPLFQRKQLLLHSRRTLWLDRRKSAATRLLPVPQLRGFGSMIWCSNCAKYISTPHYVDGKICCPLCGRVLDEDNFSQEATFVKNAAGQSQLSGNFVKTIQNEISLSRERTLNEAYDGIESMMHALAIDGGDSVARPALAFYTIALECNFTRGRRKELVVAACLYITCRENKKPYLLIDFSEHLRINVYVLGAVFLQLCKLLSLEEHPIVQKPVDPSLFIHRFTDRLFGGRKPTVSRTALQIVASMKRDWMQTGRKPSGLCGAALFISALAHGLKCSKSDIIKVVHVCEATLTKRLIEFENTKSGGLTIEEFNERAEELEREERLLIKSHVPGSKESASRELLCEHKGSGKPHFAHGLCESCYADFFKLSGGLEGGLDPPAFERAERERLMEKEDAAHASEEMDLSKLPGPMSDKRRNIKNMNEYEELEMAGSGLTGDASGCKTNFDSNDEKAQDGIPGEESETLSDIEDGEVEFYIHNAVEIELKTRIWEQNNKEYLEEQAAKEAAAEEKRKAYEASVINCGGDVQAAQKLSAAAREAADKKKKEKRQKRAAELMNLGPPQGPAEATRQVLYKKNLSSKIRYDVLDSLFDESKSEEIAKKRREMESEHDESNITNKSEEDPVVEDTQDTYYENADQFDLSEDYNYYDDF